MAASRSSISRRRVAWIVGALFASAAILAVLLQPKPDLFSAPSTPEYDSPRFSDFLGIGHDNFGQHFPVTPGLPSQFSLEVPIAEHDLPDWIEQWPPSEPFPDFAVKREGENVSIVSEEADAASAAVVPELFPNPLSGDLRADWDGLAVLPGGARLQLKAFAISYPKPGDPIDDDGKETTEQLLFRATDDLEQITPQELDRLDVPKRFRETTVNLRDRPQLRLLLRSENRPTFRTLNTIVYDARTQREVGREDGVDSEGEWLRLDIKLDIWHDTHLHIGLDVPCGKTEVAELKLETNQQVVLGGRVRVGFLFLAPGDLSLQHWTGADPFASADPGWQFSLSENSSGEQTGTSLLLLGGADDYPTSPNSYWQNCGVLPTESDGHRPFRFFRGKDDYYASKLAGELVYLPDRDLRMGDRIKLGFVPYRTRVWFEIPELEDMPNGSGVANLFDVRIPRSSFYMADSSDPFAHYSPIPNLIELASGAAEFDGSYASGYYPTAEGAPVLTLVDTSPRELLQFYLDNTPRTRLVADPQSRRLQIGQRESWLDRAKDWWTDLWPEWSAP